MRIDFAGKVALLSRPRTEADKVVGPPSCSTPTARFLNSTVGCTTMCGASTPITGASRKRLIDALRLLLDSSASCRGSRQAPHRFPRAASTPGRYDGLPESIRLSPYLTGNQIGFVAGAHTLPTLEEIESVKNRADVNEILRSSDDAIADLHRLGGTLADKGDRSLALSVLVLADSI